MLKKNVSQVESFGSLTCFICSTFYKHDVGFSCRVIDSKYSVMMIFVVCMFCYERNVFVSIQAMDAGQKVLQRHP